MSREGIADELQATLKSEEDWEGLGLLEDLAHPDQDHRWLWECGPPSETALSRKEFREAVLLRLGDKLVEAGTPCARCGSAMDAQCRHAMRCASGQSTRGHNRIRDTLHGLAA